MTLTSTVECPALGHEETLSCKQVGADHAWVAETKGASASTGTLPSRDHFVSTAGALRIARRTVRSMLHHNL